MMNSALRENDEKLMQIIRSHEESAMRHLVELRRRNLWKINEQVENEESKLLRANLVEKRICQMHAEDMNRLESDEQRLKR